MSATCSHNARLITQEQRTPVPGWTWHTFNIGYARPDALLHSLPVLLPQAYSGMIIGLAPAGARLAARTALTSFKSTSSVPGSTTDSNTSKACSNHTGDYVTAARVRIIQLAGADSICGGTDRNCRLQL